MKAIVRAQYGPPEVLQFAEVEKPIPKDNEVLIRVCAASVNPVDLYCMRGAPLIRSLSTPKQKVLGCDIAGRVEAVGRNVTQFQSGRRGIRGDRFRRGRVCRVCVRFGR